MLTKSNMFYRFAFLTVILTIIFTSFIGSANAQLNLDTAFNAGVTEGTAEAYVTAAQADGKILVGGRFNFANGTDRSNLVRLNTDGTLDPSFNAGGTGANGDVLDIVVLPNNKILISGGFTLYNGATRIGVALLNADGTPDTSFNSGGTGFSVGALIYNIAVQTDGKFLLAGLGVSSYNGTERFSVVRLNADGTLDTSFTSPFTTAQFVEEVDVQADGKILIGGSFSLGTPAQRDIVRLNSNGSLDTSFNSGGVGTNGGGVFAMTLQSDGRILIGGGFATYNGTARSGIARLNTDGSLDNSFVPPANLASGVGTEYIAIQPDGKILIAGRFTPSSGVVTNLVRLNSSGSLDPSFIIRPFDNFGFHVKVQGDGKIILTSFFTTGSLRRNPIVRLNSDGTVDNGFNATLSNFGFVSSIVQQSDGKILVGGNFAAANGTSRINLARFNLDGTLDTSFNPGIGNDNTTITVAVQPDGRILVGGTFTIFNGVPRQSIARLNTDGSLDISFNPTELSGGAVANTSDIIVLPTGKIIIGGRYTPGGVFQRLLRLNINGTIDDTFTPGIANSSVNDLLRQPDGKIIVSGTFSTYNGQSRPGIARVSSEGVLDATFNPGTGANGSIQRMALQPDGKVLIVGSFTSFNGINRNRVARLNADGSVDLSFNVGTGADNLVQAVTLQADGKIIIGGSFLNFNGMSRVHLARLNSDGSLDTSVVSGFANDPRFSVFDLLTQADGKILVGGFFNAYNGTPRNSLLRLTPGLRRASFDFDGDARSDLSVFRPSNGIWYLQNSQAGFSALQFGLATDRLAPADFDGDGRTDIAVFRPSNGFWYLQRSATGFTSMQFGSAEDLPQPADFDGDGRAELIVYRPSNGIWYIFNLANNNFSAFQFGAPEDKPVIGDYDGDGRTDIAVYRPSNGIWYIRSTMNGAITGTQFGAPTDRPVAADYDGDGRTDIAVFRPSNGIWYIQGTQQGFTTTQFGVATDEPAPGDYDGDGRTDIAVYRQSEGNWYLRRSTLGLTAMQFGAAEDRPIPGAFVPMP